MNDKKLALPVGLTARLVNTESEIQTDCTGQGHLEARHVRHTCGIVPPGIGATAQ